MEPNALNPYNDPGLVQARNNASTAMSNYGTAQQATLTMPDMLKAALDKKFQSQDNPLLGQRDKAFADYSNTNNTGNLTVSPENNNGMIFSPSSQLEQIQGRRTSALTSILSLTRLLAAGEAGNNNFIDQATNNYKTQELGAKNKADSARQSYVDLLDEIDKAEKVRQFNEELKVKQQSANSSDNTNDPLYKLILKKLMGDTSSSTSGPTESQPTTIPTNPNRQYRSPGGEWEFNWQHRAWVPAGVDVVQ